MHNLSAKNPESLPLVSVVVPCRNEAPFIEGCLTSIVASEYPKHRLEVIVVDGESTDGTRELIDRHVRVHAFVRRIDNPQRTTPFALNLGIRAAKGAYILWMSSHNEYPSDYISECVRWAVQSGADNVGGVIVTRPRTEGLWARAVTAALAHPFGVGGSHFRTHRPEPAWVDTVFGGCYRREVFDRIGLFNEGLTRGQDMEFNLRLSRAGGRTLLVPTIRSIYYARTRPREFLKHTWSNGEWAILPFLYSTGTPVGVRHLVPLAFAISIVAGVAAGLAGLGWWLLAAVVAPYAFLSIGASAALAWRERRPVMLVMLPMAFAMLHFTYGVGSMSGVVKLVLRQFSRRVPP